MVIERKILCVSPVISDLRCRVVAHHIWLSRPVTGRVQRLMAGRDDCVALPDETVHQAAVDVGYGAGLIMRPTAIYVGTVMIRRETCATRVRGARRELSVALRNAVCIRKRAKVVIKRSIFLSDNDDVLDLVNSGELRRAGAVLPRRARGQ